MIDSLNFLPMPLAKLLAAFGLRELKKGFFPYLFTPGMDYIGPWPLAVTYNLDNMDTDLQKEFDEWYLQQIDKVP